MYHSERSLKIYSLGKVAYAKALELQKQIHQAVSTQKTHPTILFLEHPPVITLGKNASFQDILQSPEALKKSDIDIVQVERGGQVTAHFPGQLIIYPIFPLGIWRIGPKKFVTILEEIIIAALRELSIDAYTEPQHPGVWVNQEKICALGVRISQKTSYHGLALNITRNLKLFETIIPCGFAARGVTSIETILGKPIEMSFIIKKNNTSFHSIF